MSDTLMPCPWCGKQPRTCPDDSYGSASVYCPDENDCPVSPAAGAALKDGETLADAIAAWNRRTTPRTDVDREVVARDGWIKVPIEPTPAMIDRFVSRALCVSVHGDGGWSNYAREQWSAMLAAVDKG